MKSIVVEALGANFERILDWHLLIELRKKFD